MADKVSQAINLLQLGSRMSLHYYKQPLLICNSGGKDSLVLEDVIWEVDAQPAADVVPVRHGQWRASGPLLECQSCGEIYSRLGGNAGKLWNYCPNCGAKMDGDSDES